MSSNYLITALSLTVGMTAFAQDLELIGFDYDGSKRILSARALGLGGAYTSLVDDASALHWNPAALGFMQGPSVVVGGGVQKNMGSLDLTDTYTGEGYITQTAEISESPAKFLFNQVAVAVPIIFTSLESIRFTPSIGYSFSSSNLYRKEIFLLETEYQDEFGEYQTVEETFSFDSYGGRKALSLGLGISVNDHLSFGFSRHNYSGERTSTNIHTFNGTATSSLAKIAFSGHRSSFAVKYASYAGLDPASEEYEEGADVSLVVDLPATLSSRINSNGYVETLYYNRNASYNMGFSVRSATVLFCMDGLYEPANLKTSTGVHDSTISRYYSDSTTYVSLGAGVEGMKTLRFGVRAKQYQFKNSSGDQPWTVQLNGGVSIPISDPRFNLDLAGSFEFYNWGTILKSDFSYTDYKGSLFNFLVSFRMHLPYQ